MKVSDDEYKSFINDFPFDDTEDQEIVSRDIRKDLSLIKPMNRLLCGDVGFGKTEIAMRASFISALSGKQTIILSPSTVLTDQHFESFSKRFKNFPITIEKLSRNTSLKAKEKLYKRYFLGGRIPYCTRNFGHISWSKLCLHSIQSQPR